MSPTFPFVYAIASDITCPLGSTVAECRDAVLNGSTAIRQRQTDWSGAIPCIASVMPKAFWEAVPAPLIQLTRFEQLAATSCSKAIMQAGIDCTTSDTLFILSTTKGNIELLETGIPVTLIDSAKKIAEVCGITTAPKVVSLACTSGVAALLLGQRMLQMGKYKNVVVTGCDRFSMFVWNGFQSFLALSDEVCRPFDKDRKGINLGEGAATIILTTEHSDQALATLLSGATTNDANHISGPSRTGEELAMAISRTLDEGGILPEEIGMISAHGTGTIYNDEMEAKAFALTELSGVPLHSFKGYTGHTLGAAGVLETAIALEFMQRQQLIPSYGFRESGVSQPLNVTRGSNFSPINYLLKTASGFGGCNAAMLWMRV